MGQATKRAEERNFVVTTDLGNEFASLDRELPEEAVHRTKRPEDRNATAVIDRASRPEEGAARDGLRGPRGRGAAAGHRVPAAAKQRGQVPAQQGSDRPPHQGQRTRGPSGLPPTALQAVDSMTVRSTEGREALPGSGNAAGRLTRRGRPAAARQLDDFLGQPRRPRPAQGKKHVLAY